MERTPTVGVVVLKDNNVLLVRHGEEAGHITGSYGTPGGRIDSGETAIYAGARELEEESGLIAEEKDLVELPEKYDADLARKDGSTLSVHHTVFATRKFTGELRSTKETTPEWVPIERLSSMELLPNVENMVNQALSNV
jgi:mutator protein MutT